MKVLVINCGSSSLKYQVLDMTNENLLCKGLVERIGMDGSVIGHEKIGQEKIKNEVPMKDHKDAIAQVLAAIQDPEHGVIKSMDELGAVGHRVVHAGEKYASSVLITEDVIKALGKAQGVARVAAAAQSVEDGARVRGQLRQRAALDRLHDGHLFAVLHADLIALAALDDGVLIV